MDMTTKSKDDDFTTIALQKAILFGINKGADAARKELVFWVWAAVFGGLATGFGAGVICGAAMVMKAIGGAA